MECLNNGTEQCDYASACECCEFNEARRADSMLGILVFGTWYCILNEIQTSQPLNSKPLNGSNLQTLKH